MCRNILFCFIVLLLMATKAGAQDGYSERAQKYVDQYASLAIYEQRKNGIPAAITLGQGLLETEAGTSELMTEANNHFGIKCKNGWLGETFTHTDDAPDECFKKYKCASDSYRDHSEHLKRNPRYAPLFRLKETDYKSWAVCLKRCGYATNPQYAQRLIKIIEDFDLQEYTLSAFDSSILNNYVENQVANARPPMDTVKKPVAAKEPDTKVLAQATITPIKFRGGDTVQANTAHDKHIVKDGETLALIAHNEGIELRKIMSLNMLNPNEEPVVGAVLELLTQAKIKPAVKVNAIVAHKGNAIVTGDDKTPAQNGDYVTIDKTKAKTAADSFKAKPVTPVAVTKTPVANNSVPANNATTQAVKPKPAPEIIIINDSKRPTPPPPAKTDEELAAGKQDQELAALKAELDKVVYADDSKLIAENAPPPAPEKKPVATPEKKPAPARAATTSGKFYTVQKGETAFSIAKKHNITVDQLMKWNNMESGEVKIGKTLQVKE